MSTSKSPRDWGCQPARVYKRQSGADELELPATVSRKPLLENGSDQRFRQLVYDLLTIATRMNAAREHLARGMGLSGPQYSVLMAIGRFQGSDGVSVGIVARTLHVSSAFIATQTGKLAQAGLVSKRPNPKDRRGVLLSLTRAARVLIRRNSDEIRSVNDAFFATLDRKAFVVMSTVSARLVGSSDRAMARIEAAEAQGFFREAAE